MAKVETPIPHTCPDIDKVIKYINSAQKAISRGLKTEDVSYFEDAESDPELEIYFDASWDEVKDFFKKEIPIIAKKLMNLKRQ